MGLDASLILETDPDICSCVAGLPRRNSDRVGITSAICLAVSLVIADGRGTQGASDAGRGPVSIDLNHAATSHSPGAAGFDPQILHRSGKGDRHLGAGSVVAKQVVAVAERQQEILGGVSRADLAGAPYPNRRIVRGGRTVGHIAVGVELRRIAAGPGTIRQLD